jgi:hypothetical protein
MADLKIDLLPDSKKYYTSLSIGKYKKSDPFTPSAFERIRIFHFPLPTELRDDTTVGYTAVNLETVGDIINNAAGASGTLQAATLRGAGGLLNAVMSGTQRGFERAAGPVAGALAGSVASIAQSLLPAEQVSSAIQQKIGAAPNPNPSVQFQGPVLRDFSFTWVFYPKSYEESVVIDSAIRTLKGAALPSFNEGNRASILNYPYLCQLNFYPWDGTGESWPKDNPYGWKKGSIIKIKNCFMSGVNVNYHAFGTPAFFEGKGSYPVSIQLTINFKETEYLTAYEWDDSRSKQEEKEVKAAAVVGALGNTLLEGGKQIIGGVFKETLDLLQVGEGAPSPKTEAENEADAKSTIAKTKTSGTVNYRLAPTATTEGQVLGAQRGEDGKWTVYNVTINPDNTEVKNSPAETLTDAQFSDYLKANNAYKNGQSVELSQRVNPNKPTAGTVGRKVIPDPNRPSEVIYVPR